MPFPGKSSANRPQLSSGGILWLLQLASKNRRIKTKSGAHTFISSSEVAIFLFHIGQLAGGLLDISWLLWRFADFIERRAPTT
jgi:hypothetical protein